MRSFWEYCILHEHDILREIKNAIDDPGPKPAGGGHSGVSKPTEIIAMKNLTRVIKEIKVNNVYVVPYPQSVIDAIRYVRASVNLNVELGPIYQDRYIHEEKWRLTCKRLDISKQTYNKRVWKIIKMLDKRYKMRGSYED